jgi:hypothetical protein
MDSELYRRISTRVNSKDKHKGNQDRQPTVLLSITNRHAEVTVTCASAVITERNGTITITAA